MVKVPDEQLKKIIISEISEFIRIDSDFINTSYKLDKSVGNIVLKNTIENFFFYVNNRNNIDIEATKKIYFIEILKNICKKYRLTVLKIMRNYK